MSKVALISDLHFGVRKNSEVYSNSQIRFLRDQFVPYLKEQNIKKVYILGDLFDNRSSINTKIQNVVFDLFHDILPDFEITILIGNHDCYFNSSIDINSVKFLSEFRNVTLIDKLTVEEFEGKKILLTPWIVNFNEFIKEIADKNFDLCFGHLNLHGFNYNKFKISEDGLDGGLFGNRCKKVFTGHFHIRSKKVFSGCEIVYIGSPYQLSRNDINEERGFATLDMDTLEYEFVDNKISMKFVNINYPEKITRNLIEGNIIDVHVKYNNDYNEELIDSYIKHISELNPAMDPTIIIETDQMIDSNFDMSKLNMNSIPDLMKEYVNTLDIKDKEKINEILIDLYNESKGAE